MGGIPDMPKTITRLAALAIEKAPEVALKAS